MVANQSNKFQLYIPGDGVMDEQTDVGAPVGYVQADWSTLRRRNRRTKTRSRMLSSKVR